MSIRRTTGFTFEYSHTVGYLQVLGLAFPALFAFFPSCSPASSLSRFRFGDNFLLPFPSLPDDASLVASFGTLTATDPSF